VYEPCMHRPFWPHLPYTICMAVLYTKQRTVKLSKMLMKSRPTRHPHRLSQQTRIGRRTAQLLIKAGAWFIHWPVRPVRGLYRPYLPSTKRKQHKSYRNSSSAQRYDGASTTNRLPYDKHILQISSLYEFCPDFTNANDNFDPICIRF